MLKTLIKELKAIFVKPAAAQVHTPVLTAEELERHNSGVYRQKRVAYQQERDYDKALAFRDSFK